jgi:hypothetical protein
LLGWVTERSIVHAWKACVPKGTGGSNPPPSAPIVERVREIDCITVSHNKSADFRRYSTLLFEVIPDKQSGDEEGIEAPGGGSTPGEQRFAQHRLSR